MAGKSGELATWGEIKNEFGASMFKNASAYPDNECVSWGDIKSQLVTAGSITTVTAGFPENECLTISELEKKAVEAEIRVGLFISIMYGKVKRCMTILKVNGKVVATSEKQGYIYFNATPPFTYEAEFSAVGEEYSDGQNMPSTIHVTLLNTSPNNTPWAGTHTTNEPLYIECNGYGEGTPPSEGGNGPGFPGGGIGGISLNVI